MKLFFNLTPLSYHAINSCFIFLLVIFLSCNTSNCLIKLPENITIPALFAFGDSVFDTGNNNGIRTIVKANFPPYGRDFPGGKPTGRFSNGKIATDIIAEELGIKELLPPYLGSNLQSQDLKTGVNFASGGSGFDPLTSIIVEVISADKQLEMFKTYTENLRKLLGEEKTRTILSESVYIVSAISNDIANTYFHTPTRILEYNVSSYSQLLVTSASTFLEELYKLGARRLLYFGAPPIGCLPMQRTLGGGIERKCVENYNTMAKLFNSEVIAALERINGKNKESRMVYVDIYTPLLDMIQNPQEYGFEVWDKGCCGTGLVEVSFLCTEPNIFTCENASTYLFWDSYHPTERAYRIIVDYLLQNAVNKIFTN
ncbi:GDSL esterase/lipase At5g42170-like [Carica papaya]|uniref:GDSL esterase/lipase At5g42170-like n=1 Tax=Carica papaya TaxID=3649 RepID=UPI000B8CFE17|nr:GDSL esterase/lipase At5g42170-like [Carica papaya]